MATGYEWTELALKYSKQLLAIVVFILSLGGYGLYDFVDTVQKEKNIAIQEVAVGFQTVMQEVAPIEEKPDKCYNCDIDLKNHIKEYKRNLYEFHGVR